VHSKLFSNSFPFSSAKGAFSEGDGCSNQSDQDREYFLFFFFFHSYLAASGARMEGMY